MFTILVANCKSFNDCMNCSMASRCEWKENQCTYESDERPWWNKVNSCNYDLSNCPQAKHYVLNDDIENALEFKFPESSKIPAGTFCHWSVTNPKTQFVYLSIKRSSVIYLIIK